MMPLSTNRNAVAAFHVFPLALSFVADDAAMNNAHRENMTKSSMTPMGYAVPTGTAFSCNN
jgi:hypothetical protein